MTEFTEHEVFLYVFTPAKCSKDSEWKVKACRLGLVKKSTGGEGAEQEVTYRGGEGGGAEAEGEKKKKTGIRHNSWRRRTELLVGWRRPAGGRRPPVCVCLYSRWQTV